MVSRGWTLNIDCKNQMLLTKNLNLKELDKDAAMIRDYLLQYQWCRDAIKHPAAMLPAVPTSHGPSVMWLRLEQCFLLSSPLHFIILQDWFFRILINSLSYSNTFFFPGEFLQTDCCGQDPRILKDALSHLRRTSDYPTERVHLPIHLPEAAASSPFPLPLFFLLVDLPLSRMILFI